MFKIENLNVGQNPILCHNSYASLSGICSLRSHIHPRLRRGDAIHKKNKWRSSELGAL